MGRRVERLAGQTGGHFVLGTDQGDDDARAKAVILAAGAGAFGPNRPAARWACPRIESTGAVQYYVRRREDYRGL